MSFDFWLGLEVAGEPTPEHAQKLIANFDSQCQQAASALHKADVLVLFTGAGFSADSGLAVYADVARVPAYQERGLDYCDICQPFWLESDPDLFYGFWGQCFSDYRTTRPHEGYNIIARWRDDKNEAKGASVAEDIRRRVLRKMELRRPFEQDDVTLNKAYEVTGGPAGAFYSFTSNVDAHFFDVFEAHEIHECHGNIETWQCSSPYCFSGVWRVPIDHYFVVDQETMLAPPNKCLKKENKEDTPKKSATEDNNIKTDKNDAAKQSTDDEKRIGDGVAHIGRTKGNKERSNILKNMPPPLVNPGPHADKAWERTSNWPKCGHCLSPARPAILMFGDFSWKPDQAQAMRWTLWKEALLDHCEKRKTRTDELQQSTYATNSSSTDKQHITTTISPLRVCIMEIGCGMTVPTCRSNAERLVCELQQRGGDVTMVRVNPDYPLASIELSDSVIPIMSRGLEAIKKIDQFYRSLDG